MVKKLIQPFGLKKRQFFNWDELIEGTGLRLIRSGDLKKVLTGADGWCWSVVR
jgi:hypothetical protein